MERERERGVEMMRKGERGREKGREREGVCNMFASTCARAASEKA